MDEAKLAEIDERRAQVLRDGTAAGALCMAADDVPALVAEVRRLTAALDAARREGAEGMRERCDDALDSLERHYRAAERDVKAHVEERGAAWERGAAIENARDTVRTLPLDAPGGGS